MSYLRCDCWSIALTCAWSVVASLGVVAGDEPDVQAVAELHRNEAHAYSFFLDSGKMKPVEIQAEPIFKWQNLTAQGGQLGAIYAWMREGRPEVLGTIFSQHEEGKRNVLHEFHTLADAPLTVVSPKDVKWEWKPTGSLPITRLENAGAVADTPAKRLLQMRAISREFSGYTQREAERIELRLAPQPLIRYQPTRSDVLDGAIFAFLSSAAGTDPEFMLLIEARKAEANAAEWSWHVGVVRFTERDLVVARKEKEIFSSISNPQLKVKIEDSYRWCHNSDDTYCVFHAKFVPEFPKKVN